MRRPLINLKLLLVWLVLCAIGGALFSWLTDMPYWLGAAIVAIALLVNGVVASVEDNAPGGFNNPRGRS